MNFQNLIYKDRSPIRETMRTIINENENEILKVTNMQFEQLLKGEEIDLFGVLQDNNIKINLKKKSSGFHFKNHIDYLTVTLNDILTGINFPETELIYNTGNK